ncbi:hypothetical protein F5884DRAFT_739941 [Xylogone sp. PMI_703]|nr:hypothetical protein F5884DRAFT_739941 [Xylogone sp. PMI_703]
MNFIELLFAFLAITPSSLGAPPPVPGKYPVPGQSPIYSIDQNVNPPFPGNLTGVIAAATGGVPDPDDNLFQNLLSAEWIIYSFYQQAVEIFKPETFTNAGFPNTTWESIAAIRDNEAGHLQLFYENISPHSAKPGPCKYDYGLNSSNPEDFLAKQVLIEIASMAFLTGLTQQAKTNATKGALTAVAATETRHEVWALLDIWGTSPFGGPVDTSFPYANQILQTTTGFIVPGSCPKGNPPYPNPSQDIPGMSVAENVTSIKPGSKVQWSFNKETNFHKHSKYWAVFFHAAYNISVPFDAQTMTARIPEEIEPRGLVLVVIATKEGAVTEDSVVAGPATVLYQPEELSLEISKSL